jgi:hypothetical protein
MAAARSYNRMQHGKKSDPLVLQSIGWYTKHLGIGAEISKLTVVDGRVGAVLITIEHFLSLI